MISVVEKWTSNNGIIHWHEAKARDSFINLLLFFFSFFFLNKNGYYYYLFNCLFFIDHNPFLRHNLKSMLVLIFICVFYFCCDFFLSPHNSFFSMMQKISNFAIPVHIYLTSVWDFLVFFIYLFSSYQKFVIYIIFFKLLISKSFSSSFASCLASQL